MVTDSIVIPAVRFGAPSSVRAVRSLSNLDVNTIVVSEDQPTPAQYSRYADESLSMPDPEIDLLGYKNALLSLAARQDVQSILPVRELDIYILSKFRNEFANHLTPLWPNLEKLRYAHDRIKLFELAEELEIPIPETGLYDDEGFSAQELVVKSRYGILTPSYKGDIPHSETQVPPKQLYFSADELPSISEVTSIMGHNPLMQEFINGTEYNYRAIYKNGTPRAENEKRKLRCMRYYGGASVYRDIVDLPRLRELGRRLLDHIGWEGLASVQFIKDEDSGEFKLLEVNPRLWASVACDINAGIDYPRYYWELSNSNSVTVKDDVGYDKPTHYLYGELTYLNSILEDDFPFTDPPSIPRALWDIGSSIITNPRFDSLSLRDPIPFLVEGYLRAVPERFGFRPDPGESGEPVQG